MFSLLALELVAPLLEQQEPSRRITIQDALSLDLTLYAYLFLCFYIEHLQPFLTQKGSILAVPTSLNEEDAGKSYVVEGIGYDFVPDVLNRSDVDVWLKTSDEESFEAVRLLMRSEGLLVGGSSGTALAGALRWLKTAEGQIVANKPGKNVVVLLPDG
jgi:hypothetical protein